MSRGVGARVASLASVLRRDPAEFADRIGAIVAGRMEALGTRAPAYAPLDWSELPQRLPAELRDALLPALAEPALAEHERGLGELRRRLHAGGIDARHDGDVLLGRCCFAVVRMLKPDTVVETGVAHGVTSSYILAALHENGRGELHSIDLPPHDAGAEAAVGSLVDGPLRARWQLHRGMARRVLPRLLRELGTLDVFVHDSLHTYRNMRMEFAETWPRLSAHGAIIADDVEGNRAFLELARLAPRFWGVFAEATKPALFGVLLR